MIKKRSKILSRIIIIVTIIFAIMIQNGWNVLIALESNANNNVTKDEVNNNLVCPIVSVNEEKTAEGPNGWRSDFSLWNRNK